MADRWTAAPGPNESVQGVRSPATPDGDLAEFNNPMPRWWLWMFYLTMVFTGVYVALIRPQAASPALLGWTQEGQWQSEMKHAADKYDPIFKKYAGMDIAAVAATRRH